METPGASPWRTVTLAVVVGCAGALALAGCVAIANVDDIEFGAGGAGGTAAGGGGSGAIGADGGGGSGATSSCTDGTLNGQETGLDCGGPDCPACAEDCTNGIDDNGDDRVDCEDPICGGYECVPPIPGGWGGPMAFFVGSSNTAPTCDPAWEETVSAGSGTLNAPGASCTPCSCDDPTGEICRAALELWDVDGCPTSDGEYRPLLNGEGVCHPLGGGTGITWDSVIALPFVATGGSCDANGGQADVTPATWTEQAILCRETKTGGGCADDGYTCARSPSDPFRSGPCIATFGDSSCPAGPYSEKRVVYGAIQDSRGCSTCSCSSAQGGTCTGHFALHGDASCSMVAVQLVAPSNCTDFANLQGASYHLTSEPNGGSCQTQGGQPQGTATPANPVTVCCVP